MSRVRGCLLGGALGDALGAPVEFWTLAEIRRAFERGYVDRFIPAYGRIGAITDDTQMTLFSAEGLLRAKAASGTTDEDAMVDAVHDAYLRWLWTQGVRSAHPRFDPAPRGGLVDIADLRARRAPGATCIGALSGAERGTLGRAPNDSKGCGGLMRVAPVAFIGARDPFRLGCKLAALTHGHPTGWLAAGAFALLLAQIAAGETLRAALDAMDAALAHEPRADEVRAAVASARQAADAGPPCPETLARLGEGWIAEEALGIAVYCALVASDVRSGLSLAVSHSGDSDSTGELTGQILGALWGEEALPRDWLQDLELRKVIEDIANRLAAA